MSDYLRFHRFPIDGVDSMTACTARAFPRHTHDQYGIGVVDAGGHASWSGCGQVEAGPRQLICVNPGEVHDGRAVGARTRSWRMLYLDVPAVSRLRADIFEGAADSFTFAAPVFVDEPLRQRFVAAFAFATGSDLPARMACETALLTLVARLDAHSTCAHASAHGTTACVRRARHRIDSDPAAPFTLVELASEAGVSRYQLIRGFARDLGLTPHAYILQQRIALARRLIRGGCELAEVAASAGFYDQSHLARCFVRQFGVTPRRYALLS